MARTPAAKNQPQVPEFKVLTQDAEMVNENLDIIRENLAGEKLNPQDLERITIPSGTSAPAWAVTTAAGTKAVEHIDGIMIAITSPRAYWSKAMEEDGKSPPDCSSPDGQIGYGDPGGDCVACPFNEWGTSKTGSKTGKACKEQRLLFMLTPDNFLPVVVQAPVTSIENVRKYNQRLSTIPKLYKHVYTRLTLNKVDGDPFEYYEIVPQHMGNVEGDQLEILKAYVASLTPLLSNPQYQPEPIRMEAVEAAKAEAEAEAEQAALQENQERDEEPQEPAAQQPSDEGPASEEPDDQAPEGAQQEDPFAGSVETIQPGLMDNTEEGNQP